MATSEEEKWLSTLKLDDGYTVEFANNPHGGDDLIITNPDGEKFGVQLKRFSRAQLDREYIANKGIMSLVPMLVDRLQEELAVSGDNFSRWEQEVKATLLGRVEEAEKLETLLRITENEISMSLKILDSIIDFDYWPERLVLSPLEEVHPDEAPEFQAKLLALSDEERSHFDGLREELQERYQRRDVVRENLARATSRVDEKQKFIENDVGEQRDKLLRDQYEVRQRLEWLSALQKDAVAREKVQQFKADHAAIQEKLRQLENKSNEQTKSFEALIKDTDKAEKQDAVNKDNVAALEAYYENRKKWGEVKRFSLRKSTLEGVKDKRPIAKAAAKLTAMGDMLFSDTFKLRLFQNATKATHFREMLALRAGYVFEGRELKVRVIERIDTKDNWCLCQIKGTDIITVLTIEFDERQHHKAVASTCLSEDPMWTTAENETPGVPPSLSQFERDEPHNLKLYAKYHRIITANIDESRQAAE